MTRDRQARRQGRDRRTRKQSEKASIEHSKKTRKHKNQRVFTSYAKSKYDVDCGAGHSILQNKDAEDIRVYLQNPNGVLGMDTKYDDRRVLLQLQEWDVNIIALPETNRNWKVPWLQDRWESEVQRVWRHAKVFNSSINTDQRNTKIQGGVSLIVTNRWASRVVDHGEDPLGRWAWVQLRGKSNEMFTCMAMYQPNPGSPDNGPETVWTQQYQHRLQEVLDKEGDTESIIDPREKILLDMNEWISQNIGANDQFVLLTDANQSLDDNTTTYSLRKLIQDNTLHSTMELKHPGESVRSTNRGSKTIDHILIKNIPSDQVKRSGQLPFELGFHTDHRGMFTDIDVHSILGIYVEDPIEQAQRRLSSKNKKVEASTLRK